MMKMKKVLLSISMVVVLTLSLGMSVLASSPSTNQFYIGSIVVLKGGYVATVTGFTDSGTAILTADMSTPVYEDDLTTKIDTTWHINPDGSYTNGADNFISTVIGTLTDIAVPNTTQVEAWNPDVSLATQVTIGSGMDRHTVTQNNILVASDDGAPTLLPVDPINSNYQNNTLQWDLGNGVYRNLRLIAGEEQEYYTITNPLDGDITIQTNEIDSGIMASPITVYDSSTPQPQNIPVTVDDSGNITLLQSDIDALPNDVVYPIIIDPSTSFNATSVTGDIYDDNVTWATVHNETNISGNGAVESPNYNYLDVTTENVASFNYIIYRGFLFFDTSPLSGYTVTSAYLNLNVSTIVNGLSSSIEVQNGQPTYPHSPLVSGDFNYSNYSGNGGSITDSSLAVNSYTALNLNATGYGWINTTGTTALCLRDLNYDINNSAPPYGTYNFVQFYNATWGVGYQPQLIVTFNAIVPSVVSQTATSIASTTTQLNASLTNDGNYGAGGVSIQFGYGTTSETAGNFANYTTLSGFSGNYASGSFPYLVATGLTVNTTYYYRVQAQNAAGTVTSSSEQTFTTTAVVGSIASFYGYPTSTDITLNWVLGSGDSQAMVRYSTLKYPTSISDGTLVITQAATSYDLTGLSSGQTYYFSIWGLSGVTYSASAVNLVSTTSGAEASGGSDTYPPMGAFEQTISSNKLAQFQPVYSFVNDFINGWGMPNATGWFLAWLALSMFMGLGAGFLTHKLLVGAVLLDIMLLMGILLGLITGWMLMVIFVVALGEWAIFKYVM